jgi:hypothetical protein
MKADLIVDLDDLKALFVQSRSVYGTMSFPDWCEECKKSYMSYFNNEELFRKKKHTYSQWVNSQIRWLTANGM